MSDSPLVHLVTAGNNMEASLLRSYLEDHGIYCFIQGENHRSMLGNLGAFIDVNLMVSEADLDQARLLLEAYEAAPTDSDSDSGEGGEEAETGAPGEDETDVMHGQRHRALMRLRGARICGLCVPLGIVHLLVGAYGRGIIMMAVCAGAWYMAMTNRAWALLIPVTIIFDMIGAGRYVRGQVEKQAAASSRD